MGNVVRKVNFILTIANLIVRISRKSATKPSRVVLNFKCGIHKFLTKYLRFNNTIKYK